MLFPEIMEPQLVETAPPDVTVGLLGPIVISDALNGEVGVHGRVQRRVLALLAISRGVRIPTDYLIDNVWIGQPPSTASSALRVHIAQLRAALRGSSRTANLLEYRDSGYRLDPVVGSDADTFERYVRQARDERHKGELRTAVKLLSAALAMWRGLPLGGMDDIEPFSRWARQMEESKLGAEEAMVDNLLDLGEHSESLGLIRRHVDAAPSREHRSAQLMTALYRSGRQADALAACRRLRSWLADSLGVDPSPEIQRLEGAILRQEASLDRPLARPSRGSDPAGSLPLPGPDRPRSQFNPALGDIVSARLDVLRSDDVATLGALAILDEPHTIDDLSKVLGISTGDLSDSLHRIQALGGLLQPLTEGRASLRGSRIARVIIERLSGSKLLRRLHLAAASLSGQDERSAALHLLEAVPELAPETAMRRTAAAVRVLGRSGDFEAVVALSRRALAVADEFDGPPGCRLDLHISLIGGLRSLGHVEEAQERWTWTIKMARKLGDAERFAIAVLARDWGGQTISVDSGYVTLLREALAALAPQPSALRVRIMSALLREFSLPGRMEECAALADEVQAGASAVGDDESLIVALHARHVLHRPRPMGPEIQEITADVERIAARSGQPYGLALAPLLKAYDSLRLGHGAALDAAFHVRASDAGDRAFPRLAWHRLLMESAVRQMRGEFGEAEELADRAAMVGATAGIRDAAPAAVVHYFVTSYLTASVAPLLPMLESYVAAQPAVVLSRAGLSLALAQDGRALDAIEQLELYLATVADQPPDETLIFSTCVAAEGLSVAGGGDIAMRGRLRAILLPYAGEFATVGLSSTFGPVDLYLGTLACNSGDLDEARARLNSSVNQCIEAAAAAWTRACTNELNRVDAIIR